MRYSIVGSDAITALDLYRGPDDASPPQKVKRPTTAVNRSSQYH